MPADRRVDSIVDAWQAAVAAGRPVALADLCRDCPDLLAAAEAEVALLRQFDGLAGATGDAPTADYEGDTSTRSPDTGAPGPLPGSGAAFAGFRLLGVLGEGGFGVVYRAADPDLRRKVALKVLKPAALARPEARAAFLAEARALAAVQSDHVVPVYQVGEADGRPFLAMPLLGGETLAARLERDGALPAAEVARIGREAAVGLAALHAKGLVHRDVKPANLWLEAGTGRVKVLDLGLARDPLAPDGAAAGTPPYMSPEQAAGGDLDCRSDLFSLGSVLYECASGRRAFAADSVADTLRLVREAEPPPADRANPGVPAGLAGLIGRLLRKRPADRPASAAAVAQELAAWDGRPQVVPAPTRRPRWPVLVGALVVLGGVGLWAALRPPAQGPTPPDEQRADPVRYRGSVDLYVYRKDDTTADKLVPLWDPRAMPLKPGDQVKVVAEVDPPAFLYVFWIDEKAEAVPAYPWRFGEWDTRPAAEGPVAKRDIKWPGGEALKIEGAAAGTETVLMLARPTKLEATDAEVRAWFAGLRPVPFQGDKAKVWFEDFDVLTGDRDRAPGMAGPGLDGPRGLQAALRQRIGAGFSRAVSFSRRGAE
jgi:serine/threonine protein kinase